MPKVQHGEILKGMAGVEILTGVGNLILAVGFLNIYLIGVFYTAGLALVGFLGLVVGYNLNSPKKPFGAAGILLWVFRLLLLVRFMKDLTGDYSYNGGERDFRLYLSAAILNGSGAAIFLILYLVREYRLEKMASRK